MKKEIFLLIMFLAMFNQVFSGNQFRAHRPPEPVDPWKYTEAKVTLLEEAPAGSKDRIGEIVEVVITEKYTGTDPHYKKMSYPALKLRVKEKQETNWYKCEVIGIYPANVDDPAFCQSTEIRDCPNMNFDDTYHFWDYYLGPLYMGNYTKLLNRVDKNNLIYYCANEIAEECEIDDFYKKNLTGIHLWTISKISAKPFQQIERYVGDGGIGDDGEPFFRISFNYLEEIPDSTFINIQALREIYPVRTEHKRIVLPTFSDNSFHPFVYNYTALVIDDVYEGVSDRIYFIGDPKWCYFVNKRKYKEVDREWNTVKDVVKDFTEFDFNLNGSEISIRGMQPNSVVDVYDLFGRHIKSCTADDLGVCEFSLQNSGIYVIKADRFTKKVCITPYK